MMLWSGGGGGGGKAENGVGAIVANWLVEKVKRALKDQWKDQEKENFYKGWGLGRWFVLMPTGLEVNEVCDSWIEQLKVWNWGISIFREKIAIL